MYSNILYYLHMVLLTVFYITFILIMIKVNSLIRSNDTNIISIITVRTKVENKSYIFLLVIMQFIDTSHKSIVWIIL